MANSESSSLEIALADAHDTQREKRLYEIKQGSLYKSFVDDLVAGGIVNPDSFLSMFVRHNPDLLTEFERAQKGNPDSAAAIRSFFPIALERISIFLELEKNKFATNDQFKEWKQVPPYAKNGMTNEQLREKYLSNNNPNA